MGEFAEQITRNTEDGYLIGKAVARAGEQLGLKQSEIAQIIGISAAQMSNVKSGLKPITGKPVELALCLIRVFRSLDAITGGEAETTRAWMQNENNAIRGIPAQRIKEATGLVEVMNYLDAARAPL